MEKAILALAIRKSQEASYHFREKTISDTFHKIQKEMEVVW